MARLRKNDRGRWEIYGGMNPLTTTEVTSGDVIYVEVDGQDGLEPTRIEFVHDGRGGGDYVSVDDYPLWDGMRAEKDR